MALTFASASSQYLVSASALDLSAYNKVSIAFWLWWNAYANDDHLCMEFTANSGLSAETGGWFIDPNAGGGSFEIATKGISGAFGGSTVATAEYVRTSIPAGQWNHHVVTFDRTLTSNAANMYVAGALLTPGSRADNANLGGAHFGNASLYLMCRGGSTLFGDGRLAEVALFPGVILGANEAKALARGANPFRLRSDVRPYHWPVQGYGAGTEIAGGGAAIVNLTASGSPTRSVNHPPVMCMTRRGGIWVPEQAGGTAWSQGLSEAFALTDGRAVAFGKAAADTFALTDTRVMGAVKGLSQSLTLTDAITRATGKVFAEAFGLTDSRALSVAKAVLQAFGLTDVVSAIIGGHSLSQSLSEVFGLSDSVTATVGRLLALAETLLLTDGLARCAGKGLAEILNLSDARLFGLARSIGEAFGIVDTATAVIVGTSLIVITLSGGGDGIALSGALDGFTESGGIA